jgi:Na+-transporting methylmalonyl-CoA/oxaloacetate decarboxylase gamma subunit
MTSLLFAEITDGSWSDGLAIAATGLFIVFTALILISLFIASLPRVLEAVSRIWPEVDEPHATQGHPESQVPDDAAVLAAIGFVLHTELQKQVASDQSSSSHS